MAQAVSHRPLTAESRVRALVNPCGICSEQSGTGTGFSQSSSVFPCQYHSTVVLHTHISSGWWTICLLVAAVQRRSLTPSKSPQSTCVGLLLVTRTDRLTWRYESVKNLCNPNKQATERRTRLVRTTASYLRGLGFKCLSIYYTSYCSTLHSLSYWQRR
jgi:hypothetical protein